MISIIIPTFNESEQIRLTIGNLKLHDKNNQVKEILSKSIMERTDVLKEPVHRIGLSSIDPDGYKVMVNVWAPAHGYQDVKLLLQEKLIQDLKTAGVKLPGM